MRIRREFQAAVAPRNDHREEALRLDEGPHRRGTGRRAGAVMSQSSSMAHRSSQGPSRKACSAGVSAGALADMSFCQFGPAGEQFSVPPHRSRIERLAFRGGHRRQQPAVASQEGPGDEAQPQAAARFNSSSSAIGSGNQRLPPDGRAPSAQVKRAAARPARRSSKRDSHGDRRECRMAPTNSTAQARRLCPRSSATLIHGTPHS